MSVETEIDTGEPVVPYKHAEETELRPDVEALVRRLVARDRHLPDGECWPAYSDAKEQISKACGWDAPQGLYNQAQFDSAMRRYVDECGL